jgi:hypothetical protein
LLYAYASRIAGEFASEIVLRVIAGGVVVSAFSFLGAWLKPKSFAPQIGGVFLAFPAILPATATLIEKHEAQEKPDAGKNGVVQGRREEPPGSMRAEPPWDAPGLVVLAVMVWKELPKSSLRGSQSSVVEGSGEPQRKTQLFARTHRRAAQMENLDQERNHAALRACDFLSRAIRLESKLFAFSSSARRAVVRL